MEVTSNGLAKMIDYDENCNMISRLSGTFDAKSNSNFSQTTNGFDHNIYIYSKEEEYYGLVLYKTKNSFGFEMLHRDEDGDGILDKLQFHFIKE